MKTYPEIKFEKKVGLIVTMINCTPGGVDEQRSDEESRDVNKDPVIGGADDVHRENPTDDVRDSDLVDAEPLQNDVDRAEDRSAQTDKDKKGEEFSAPSDSEEENLEISNLDDNEDIIDDSTEI